MGDGEVLMAGLGLIVVLFVLFMMLMREMPIINALMGSLVWLHTWPIAELTLKFPFLLKVPFFGNWLFETSTWAHLFLEQGNFAYMSLEQLNKVMIAGGRIALLYYGWILVLLAWNSSSFRVDKKYRNLYSLETMIAVQSEEWKGIRLSRSLNPAKMSEVSPQKLARRGADIMRKRKASPSRMVSIGSISLSPGNWARAMRPEEYLLANGLSIDVDTVDDAVRREVEDESVFECRKAWESLDVDTMNEVLASQLRTPWRGAKKLRIHQRGLFAGLALLYAFDIHRANDLFNRIAMVSVSAGGKSGMMDAAIAAENNLLKEIDSIVSSKAGQKLEELATGLHAYVESAMPVFLATARKNRGVLATASFIWLKGEDRLLWYILSAVGNEAIPVEAAGAHAHSRAELQTGTQIFRPAVYQASRAILEDYLDLTPDRIAVRHKRENVRRKIGEQIDMTMSDIQARIEEREKE